MKKFFYTLLLVAGVSLMSNAQMISSARTNDQTSKFTSAVNDPMVNLGTITIAKDATEVALTETSYWKPKNSWGSSWKKIDILCPDGTIISMVDVPCDESISTAGWDEGMYTATLTDGTGASYTETFMVN